MIHKLKRLDDQHITLCDLYNNYTYNDCHDYHIDCIYIPIFNINTTMNVYIYDTAISDYYCYTVYFEHRLNDMNNSYYFTSFSDHYVDKHIVEKSSAFKLSGN